MRVIERFHSTLHRTVGTDVHQTGVKSRVMLRRFGNRLIDRNGDEAAAIRNLIGLAGIRRIDERLDIQRTLDEITELGHAAGGVDTGLTTLDHHAGVFVCQNTHLGISPYIPLVIGGRLLCLKCLVDNIGKRCVAVEDIYIEALVFQRAHRIKALFFTRPATTHPNLHVL